MAEKRNMRDLFSKNSSIKTEENKSEEVDSNSNYTPSYKFSSTSIPTNDLYYKTKNSTMGIALIFNHNEYLGNFNTARPGNDYDTECITESLQNYGFEVRTFKDRIKVEIHEILKDVSQEDHSKNDCFVVVVMTHGKKGELSAYDDYYSVENLWTPFFGDNCKTLINKPKLFFIQACRGLGLDAVVEYKDNKNSELIPAIDEDKTTKTYFIPNSADILIMYSCYEGKSSCRDPIRGTWFIQSISQLLNEYSKLSSGIDLYHLLTLINQKVAYEYETNILVKNYPNMKKQMPNFTSTLTKLFLLKPKRNTND